jgi:hypothetical protein
MSDHGKDLSAYETLEVCSWACNYYHAYRNYNSNDPKRIVEGAVQYGEFYGSLADWANGGMIGSYIGEKLWGAVGKMVGEARAAEVEEELRAKAAQDEFCCTILWPVFPCYDIFHPIRSVPP